MILHVFWLCFTLPSVTMEIVRQMSEMALFRKCTQEETCDTSVVECAPCGVLQSFNKCLQLPSCKYVRFNPNELIGKMCLASDNGSSVKPRNSDRDEDWVCRSKASSDPCLECQPGSRCIQSRSGQTSCVQYDYQQSRRICKTSAQSGRSTRLLNMTKQDLRDNWRTSEIHNPDIMIMLTWSPLCVNDFYVLSKDGSNYNIKLFKFNGNSLKKQITWDNVLLPVTYRDEIWKTIDTGRCLIKDDIACIYLFKKGKRSNLFTLHLRIYREVKSPRGLELEKEGDIIPRLRAGWKSVYLYNNLKFGMSLYYGGMFPQKYNIQVGENGFTLIDSKKIIGLRWAMNIKYDKEGSFAFAISLRNMYLIRYFENKEKTILVAKHNGKGHPISIWTDTSILVLLTEKVEGKAMFLKIHDF